MAETGSNSPEKKYGCGLLGAVFGRWSGKSTPKGSLPVVNNSNSNNIARVVVDSPSSPGNYHHPIPPQKVSADNTTPVPIQFKAAPYPQNHGGRNDHGIVGKLQSSAPEGPTRKPHDSYQSYVGQQNWKVPKGSTGLSGELESMIVDHQRSKGSNILVRASSSNVMLFGNLGNLRGTGDDGRGGNFNSNNVMDYLPKTEREERTVLNVEYRNADVNRPKKIGEEKKFDGSLCRALSTRMDPEQLKIMGNEDYKNGRFAEALLLYDAAISIDPNKASYRSNKSAALTALGRLLEAVFECREAIRIEPHYHRAHHRLATLYLRLGEGEKAIYHYQHAGAEADPDGVSKVRSLQVHLQKCTDAKRLRDWNTLIKEAGLAISAGADSAPQIYALQAEALLKLHRHQDADAALSKAPDFDVNYCTKFFGPIGNANLLIVRAQIDMASGRFDDPLEAAQEAAQKAARLDGNNREVSMVIKRARAVTQARSNGNELFKASRFSEACTAYGAGLDRDPYNSVLLCNRAACLSKLGQFERALDDCTTALSVRPSYSKARLRRADCNAKLERWEASVEDYEILLKETPDNEQINQALADARSQLNKRQGH